MTGVDPLTGSTVAQTWQVQVARTFMLTCGLYDESGEFAIKVGIPSKSGVGGGIVSACSNGMGIGVYGPALGKKGNSVGGLQVLESLSSGLDLHIFNGRHEKCCCDTPKGNA